MTKTGAAANFRTRLLVLATALATAAAVAVGASAPAHAETWSRQTAFPATYASGVAVTSDGVTAVVGSGQINTISVITVATGATQTIDVGTTTGSVVMDAADAYAYFISGASAQVIRVRMSDLSVSFVTVSASPRYLLMDVSGDYLYVQGPWATDRIRLSDFSATLGFLVGALYGPIVQTDSGAIYIDATNTVQKFDQTGALVDSFSRENHVVYAAALSPDDAYLIGIDDNGNAYRTDLQSKVTALWASDLGWGAGYGDILVRGDDAYITGLLESVVTRFSLSDSTDHSRVLNLGSGYPNFIASPADGSFFLLSVPLADELVKYALPQPPSAPSAPTAVAGDGEATITASAAGTGAAATSLKVTAHPGDAQCVINDASGQCTISGLQNEVSYTFTVTARNDAGDSADSAASAPVTPGAGPSASGLSITGSLIVGSTLTARVAGQSGSGTVERTFTWQRKKGAGAWVTVQTSSANTYVLKTADIGSVMRVSASLTSGFGDATVTSASTSVVLSRAAKPAAPGSVRATVKAKTTKSWAITVAWAKVTSPTDDPITKYSVACKAGKITLTATENGAATSAVLKATKPATYSCTVTATRGRGGTSVASTPAKAVIK